jgi:hypothetical protein
MTNHSEDPMIQFMISHDIPITRENYIRWNWFGDLDPNEPLPAECEAEIPDFLREELTDGHA